MGPQQPNFLFITFKQSFESYIFSFSLFLNTKRNRFVTRSGTYTLVFALSGG